jgi:hypothetical protein
MPRLVPAPCGEKIEGLFFEVFVPLDIPEVIAQYASPGVVLGVDGNWQSNHTDFVYVEDVLGQKPLRRVWQECPANPQHVTRRQLNGLLVDAFGGSLVRNLVSVTTVDSFLVVSEDMAKRLTRVVRRLRQGQMSLERLKINVNQSAVPELRLWVWQFLGRASIWPHRIEGGSNACPFCGRPNVFCEGCTNSEMQCESCCAPGIFVDEKQWGGLGDPRIVYNDSITSILDGRAWDGSDLLQVFSMYTYRYYASRRFIEWMLTFQAGLFAARPVSFCVDGVSSAQQTWLDEVQRPL